MLSNCCCQPWVGRCAMLRMGSEGEVLSMGLCPAWCLYSLCTHQSCKQHLQSCAGCLCRCARERVSIP